MKKTGCLVTTEDSFFTCGVGAEIVVRFTERAMDYLENVVRIACPDIPAPFSPHQKAYISDKDAIVKAIRNVV